MKNWQRANERDRSLHTQFQVPVSDKKMKHHAHFCSSHTEHGKTAYSRYLCHTPQLQVKFSIKIAPYALRDTREPYANRVLIPRWGMVKIHAASALCQPFVHGGISINSSNSLT